MIVAVLVMMALFAVLGLVWAMLAAHWPAVMAAMSGEANRAGLKAAWSVPAR